MDNSLMLKKEELEHKYPNLCEQLMEKADVGKKCSENIEVVKDNAQLKADLYDYGKDNLAWINMYFSETFTRKLVRDQKITITSFIANIGGLMGLCMGFSLVSALEFLFFLCLRSSRK